MIRLAGGNVNVKVMETQYTVDRNSNNWRDIYFNHNLNAEIVDIEILVNGGSGAFFEMPKAYQESGWWGYFGVLTDLNTLQLRIARETAGTHGQLSDMRAVFIYQ